MARKGQLEPPSGCAFDGLAGFGVAGYGIGGHPECRQIERERDIASRTVT